MTCEELARYNGKNGQAAYVAVGNVIYDVSQSPMWQGGNHVSAHQAGCDLTLELKEAPHIAAVIERFPVVGRLEEIAAPGRKSLGLPVVLIVLVLGLVSWWLLR